MNPGERDPLKLLIRGFEPHSIIIGSGSRTAAEYSNVMDCEQLRATSSGPLTSPNDRERPCRREFASRGSGVSNPLSSTRNSRSGADSDRRIGPLWLGTHRSTATLAIELPAQPL